ncbi:MAG TPA: hypothetical protein VGH28_03985 [Polyangiaceae bacterium]|jgi:hypothetical protein
MSRDGVSARHWVALAVLCATVAVSARADATGAAAASASAAASTAPPPGAPPLSVHAQPIFGVDGAVGFGWQDFVVTIDNPTPSQQKGTVELRSHVSTYAVDRDSFAAKAPFAVAATRSVTLRLPMRSRTDQVPQLTLRVTDDHGREIVAMPVTPNMAVQPTLVDIDDPSRLGIVLRGWPATVTYSVTPSYGYYTYAPTTAPMTIAVAAPTFDATTGDPILPTRAAAYSGVTAVLVHSDLLARLEAEPKDALLDWVAGGGTLAIVIARPEDLHGPEITKLAGTGVTTGPVNPALSSILAVPKPSTGAGGLFPTGAGTGYGGIRWDSSDDAPSPYQFIRSSPTIAPSAGGPGRALDGKLVGFAGGHLEPSGYGASATYGRGAVHLLAFDPTEAPGVDDVWVQSRIVDMLNKSWDRRAAVVFPAGANARNATYAYYGGGPGKTDDVRRALDPNENFRPALGFAAILLVLYSILVGPVNFLRAKNRGKPLRPLLLAPAFSATAFGAIVLMGLGVKGWRGRTRHLSLAETGSGQSRAAITRFRGFYTSETRSLTISASDRTSVLDVLSSDSVMDDKALVRVDRDGFSLDNITSLPWQTLVVRENGFVDLKGPVTITTTASSTDVKNGTGATLLDVLVWVPADGVRYFASIKNGDTVSATTGKLVENAATRRTTAAGTFTVHPFDPSTVAAMLASKDGDRITKTWSPMTTVAGDAVDWFPDDEDVVLAEVEGGERVKTDNGLPVENDRMLLRVVSKK